MTIIKETLLSFYEKISTALLISFLFMFFYKHCRQNGWKETLKTWFQEFKSNRELRGAFFIGMYIALVLFRTVLGREYRSETMEYILGGWGFDRSNKKEFREAVENVILLFPFTFLVFIYFGNKCKANKTITVFLRGIQMAFLFSIGIELSQVCLGFGSIQFADLVYNTLGGAIGAVCGFLINKGAEDV